MVGWSWMVNRIQQKTEAEPAIALTLATLDWTRRWGAAIRFSWRRHSRMSCLLCIVSCYEGLSNSHVAYLFIRGRRIERRSTAAKQRCLQNAKQEQKRVPPPTASEYLKIDVCSIRYGVALIHAQIQSCDQQRKSAAAQSCRDRILKSFLPDPKVFQLTTSIHAAWTSPFLFFDRICNFPNDELKLLLSKYGCATSSRSFWQTVLF